MYIHNITSELPGELPSCATVAQSVPVDRAAARVRKFQLSNALKVRDPGIMACLELKVTFICV